MRVLDRSTHNFKCPDCGLNCQLIQEGFRASMRHQLPTCKTYEATKKDGQKFLELAYVTYPQKPEPVMVALSEGRTVRAELIAANDAAPNVANDSEATVPPPASPYGQTEDGASLEPNTAGELEWKPPERSKPQPNPPRWQPLLEALSSELRALVYERGLHSTGLAQALVEAKPGDTLVGFDDSKIAGVGQAIAAICAAAKGHP